MKNTGANECEFFKYGTYVTYCVFILVLMYDYDSYFNLLLLSEVIRAEAETCFLLE